MPGAQSFIDTGYSFLEAGDARSAELHFKEALKILPSSAFARTGLALIKVGRGLLDEALRDFFVALSIEGSNTALRIIIEQALALPQFKDLFTDDSILEVRIKNFLESTEIDLSKIEDRTSFINYILRKFKFKKYLEIGCHDDQNFSLINCPYKVGVDPVQGGTLRLSSDEFFALTTDTFDLIFIDGLHHADQVYMDALNALKCVSANGIVLLHDCMPQSEINQTREPGDYIWNGDVWKAFVQLRTFPDLDIRVAAFDHGIGVIKQSLNTAPISLDKPFRELVWSDYTIHCDSWLRQGNSEDIVRWLEG